MDSCIAATDARVALRRIIGKAANEDFAASHHVDLSEGCHPGNPGAQRGRVGMRRRFECTLCRQSMSSPVRPPLAGQGTL